jgi:DNA-directed RNA polymerase specialized sigma24 family protein
LWANGDIHFWLSSGRELHDTVTTDIAMSGKKCCRRCPNSLASNALGGAEVSLQAELPAERYSTVEIYQSLQSLSAAQKTALNKIARTFAKQTRYGHEDLIQEAYLRVLGGKREWRRTVAAVPFLCAVMRSIAWDWRTESHDVHADVEAIGYEDHTAAVRIDAQKIAELFSDDPVAQKIIIALMDGARGEELRGISGLTQTEYESKRTKIRRRLEKVTP